DTKNGDYVYDLTAPFHDVPPGSTVTESFNYRIIDSDGSTSSKTISVTISDDAPVAVNIVNGTTLSEANLGSGSSPNSSLLFTTGNIFSAGDKYGADGAGTINLLSFASASNSTGTSAGVSSQAYVITGSEGLAAGD